MYALTQQQEMSVEASLEGLVFITIGEKAKQWLDELLKDIPMEWKPVAREYSLEEIRFMDEGNPNF